MGSTGDEGRVSRPGDPPYLRRRTERTPRAPSTAKEVGKRGVPPLRPDELERLDDEALGRYEAAQDRAKLAIKAWEDADQPLTVLLANGIEAAAPLLKIVIECERHAHRLFVGLPRTRRMGKPPVAVVTPLANRRIARVDEA